MHAVKKKKIILEDTSNPFYYSSIIHEKLNGDIKMKGTCQK